MFGHKHYVPILKSKQAELEALKVLGDRSTITPLIEVVPVAWDHETDRPKKTLTKHFSDVAKAIEKTWGTENSMFADVCWVQDIEIPGKPAGSAAQLFFDALRAQNVRFVPVLWMDSPIGCRTAAKDSVQRDGRGVCLRITAEEADYPPALESAINELLGFLRLEPTNVDLVLDLHEVRGTAISSMARTARSLIENLPHLTAWRTLTLAAGAFPMGQIQPNTTVSLPRTDWRIWSILVQRPGLSRLPAFGDYAIEHPDLPESLPPWMMRPSPQLRYTLEDAWLVSKARSAARFGYEQFNDLCRATVAESHYSGPTFSWGDKYIDDCANGRDGPGNAAKWRQVGFSHHFAFVVYQIANLP